MKDPRSGRSHDNLLKLNPGSPGSGKILSVWDPRSLGSHGNVAVTGSKISRIPWENENIRSNILQDPGYWILEIQDLGSFWDLGTCLAQGIPTKNRKLASPNLEVEPPFFVSVFLAWQLTLYLLASLHAQKSVFLDTLHVYYGILAASEQVGKYSTSFSKLGL